MSKSLVGQRVLVVDHDPNVPADASNHCGKEAASNVWRMVRIVLAACTVCAVISVLALDVQASSPDEDVQSLGSPDQSKQKAASDRLMRASKDSIPALLNGLESSSRRVRAQSLWVLRQIRWKLKSFNDDPVATELGKKGRVEKDDGLRRDMVLALRDLRGTATVRELKRFASEDPDIEIRKMATHLVANISQDNESEFLKERTSDGSTTVRLAAYTELAKTGDSSGRNLALRTIASSNDIGERSEAFDLLGAAGDPADASVLKNASESKAENFHSRYTAYRALWHHQLMEIPSGQRLDYLIKALDDPSEGVRDCAYIELYHSPDPNTAPRLKTYLSEKGHAGYKEAANALSARQ
jgi:HEAT repeat protein